MPFELESQAYADIHHLSNVREPTVDDLRAIIRTYPLIDNHAHNLLREEEAEGNADYPFESITSEAQGHALQEHVHSTLAHIRGIRQLAELFDCPPSLADVKAARYEWAIRDYDGLIGRCLTGTHALLIDDGLSQDTVYPVRWHDKHAHTVRRIARIEAVAAELLEQLAHAAGLLVPGVDTNWPVEKSELFLQRFNTMFRTQIKQLALDPLVRGFKSVVCYRSGLDVGLSSRYAFRPHQSLAGTSLLTSFHEFLRSAVGKHDYRVAQKEVNDFLVVAACDTLSMLVTTEGETLPIQFHTGLGDVDIDLIKSNPAYMQPLIEAFPNVDFVVLHSSYPYTREAGYLAANFANVWLDIGEIFPMISRQGQESVLRQALELTPASKILWSTDGHFYPETFYLANRQFREALENVLPELVHARDLDVQQAINIAVDILFWNSNALYKLDEERRFPQLLRAIGRSDEQDGTNQSTRTTLIADVTQGLASFSDAGLESYVSTAVASPATQRSSRSRAISTRSSQHRIVARSGSDSVDEPVPAMATSRSLQNVLLTDQNNSPAQEAAKLDTFIAKHPDTKYIWLQFISNTGTLRNRMIPIRQFRKQILSNTFVGITCALPLLLQNEWPAAGCVATGEFKIMPDLDSLCLAKGIDSPSATVQTWWMSDPTEGSLKHTNNCPRWTLKRQVQAIHDEFGLSMLMGFEVEIIFMRPKMNSSKSDYEDFETVHEVHSWSNMTNMQLDLLPMVEEIVETLASIGIHLEQFHAEAAPSQWEFPLPPLPPVQAVDQLYKARTTIGNIARKYGLKATVYPRPFAMAPGSASHAHFSIIGAMDLVEQHEDAFLAGILEHLPAIVAFTLPIEESYGRVASGIWAGGEWVTWGTQNREVPLRKCGPGHWEFKCSDGMGNMYFAMAALVAAGLDGLRRELDLEVKDTSVDVSTMSEQTRKAHGITERIPNSLELSMEYLKNDNKLREMLGTQIVNEYLAVKKAEMDFLNTMDEHRRKVWLMARY